MGVSISITAAEAVCALGDTLDASFESWRGGRCGLTKDDHGFLAGRIADRSVLSGRRYGAASNLAVQVSRRAVVRAGWQEAELRDAWLFAGSSRGNAGELLQVNGWRKPKKRFSASNSLHSEIAAAVSIELGIRGPWQMLANGCSAGLDALGMAWMALTSGLAKRAVVVAVDLPLVPELIHDFRQTRLLARSDLNDPFSPQTSGFHPGEAGVAVTLEAMDAAALDRGWCELETYRANSDAYDSLAVPADGGGLIELLRGLPTPRLICPHATGTPNHAAGEINALRSVYGKGRPPLLLLKPLTGHTLGASGLLDVALLAAAMNAGRVPANLAGLTQPEGVALLTEPLPWPLSSRIVKIASGMGGHNAAVVLKALGA